ncbi:MAG TPA: MFS transporter [Candidatus Dormibacteraeota bacterium]|nr:MFS transporter [Candidatus Dormibacteraeota bacterium]
MSKRALLGLAGAGLFVAALDAYVVVTLLPAMTGDVGLSIDQLDKAAPIVTGFLAGYVIAMPLLGAYSDVRGRAPVYAACMAAFAAASVITATAGLWSFAGLPWLVAGRFIQGLGGGGLVPLSLALAADLYRERARTIALGSMAALQEAGSVFGPLYGATLASVAAGLGGWRFVFWLNVPLAVICGAGLLAASRHATPQPSPTRSSVDWAGAALLGIGLGLLVLALYPDDPGHRAVNAYFVPAFAACVVCLAAYGWRQLRRLEPLIPRHLLRSRIFAGASLANLLVGAALMVALVDVPILGRLVFGLDQLGSGLLLTQFLAGVPIGAVAGGILAGRIGARLTAAIGVMVAAASFLQMSGWTANELALRLGPLRQADIALAACGLGFGLVIAPVTAAVLTLTSQQSHGLATSLVVLARTMGMLIGLSALTAFGLYRFHQILGTPVLHGSDVHSQVRELEALVASAFLREYREIFQVAAVICVLAALTIALTLGPQRLRATAIR